MLVGAQALASGMIGLPVGGIGGYAPPRANGDSPLDLGKTGIATDTNSTIQRANTAGESSISSGLAGFGATGGQNPTGAILGRGTGGATTAPNEREGGFWRSDKVTATIGLGGAALLLMGIGIMLQRREARLTAGGRRI